MFERVIDFWFKEIEAKKHWVKDSSFDQLIINRFKETHDKASLGELYTWRKTPFGRLAEIIVLDQFSRNMFRDTAKAFSCDGMALALSQEAVNCGVDMEIPNEWRSFIYMPYMHSESPLIHKEAVRLFSQKGMENSLDFEIKHKEIIDRFGRYPHRNKILGRESTQEELEFLNEPGSSF